MLWLVCGCQVLIFKKRPNKFRVEFVMDGYDMNRIDISAVSHLLLKYRELNEEQLQVRNSRLWEFMSRWQPQYISLREEWSATAARFNVFQALGVSEKEVRHSAFLAYLLNPTAHHDQGTLFLTSFLRWLEIDYVQDKAVLNGARVYPEFDIGDLGRIDIMVLHGTGQILSIENKVWAGEQPRQIERYQEWIDKQATIGAAAVEGSAVLFLTPDGRKPLTQSMHSRIRVIRRSYGSLGNWLRSFNTLPQPLMVIRDMYVNLCDYIERQS